MVRRYDGRIYLNGRAIAVSHTASSNNLDAADMAATQNNAVGLSVSFDSTTQRVTYTTEAVGNGASLRFTGRLFTEVLGFDDDTTYNGVGPLVPQTTDIASALSIPSATNIVDTLLRRNVSDVLGETESFAALLQSLATADDVPSVADIVSGVLSADVEEGTGTGNLATVLASIKNSITSSGGVTAAQLVAALQAADFEEGTGTETLSQVLQSILTAVGNISAPSADSIADAVLEHGTGSNAPSVINLLRICAAVLAGRSVVSGSTITFDTIGDEQDAVTVVLGQDGVRRSSVSPLT